jgi:hypothetical protein
MQMIGAAEFMKTASGPGSVQLLTTAPAGAGIRMPLDEEGGDEGSAEQKRFAVAADRQARQNARRPKPAPAPRNGSIPPTPL